MSTGSPKLMMKVELINDTDIRFTLIQMSYYYSRKMGGSKWLFTNNGWTVYQGKNFSINRKKVISLPESCLRQQTKVHFQNNEERYDYLKTMANALEFWSRSFIFKDMTMNKETKINFHKLTWIIF